MYIIRAIHFFFISFSLPHVFFHSFLYKCATCVFYKFIRCQVVEASYLYSFVSKFFFQFFTNILCFQKFAFKRDYDILWYLIQPFVWKNNIAEGKKRVSFIKQQFLCRKKICRWYKNLEIFFHIRMYTRS